MTYTQRNLMTTVRVLAEMLPDKLLEAINFQLDWLETSIEADTKEIEELKDNYKSCQLHLQVEEKWRKELEEKVSKEGARANRLSTQLRAYKRVQAPYDLTDLKY